MDLNKKLEELKPYQLNCNVFDVYSYNGLSMQDLLCQFFTKINECINVSNETIDLGKWLVNEGLEIEVVKKLMIWLEDGTLENIINVNLFNTLNEKINGLSSQLEQNMNKINEQFNTMASNVGNSQIKNGARSKQVFVTFTDDDCNEEVYTILKPLLDSKGVKASLAIPTGVIGTEGFMNESQIKELYNEGYDFMWHGHNLINFTQVSKSQLQQEYDASVKKFKEWGFKPMDSVAYPQGATTPWIRNWSTKYFKCGVDVWRGWVNKVPYPQFELSRIPFGESNLEGMKKVLGSPYDTNTLEFYKFVVDKAIAEGRWLIFMTHAWYDTFNSTQQQYLLDIIDYIKSKNIEIVTIKEGIERTGNIVTVGDHTPHDLTNERPYFSLGSNGEVDSNMIDTIISPPNRWTSSHQPWEFAQNKIVKNLITYTETQQRSYPENKYGTLITDTTCTMSSSYEQIYENIRQYYIVNKNGNVYYRNCLTDKSKWSQWHRLNISKIPTRDTYNVLSKPIDFPLDEVSHTVITPTELSKNPTLYPLQTYGTLITHTTGVSWDGYTNWELVWQEYICQTSGLRYFRVASNSNSWKEWNGIGGLANSQFVNYNKQNIDFHSTNVDVTGKYKIILSPSTPSELSNFANGVDGQEIIVINGSNNAITLKHSAGATTTGLKLKGGVDRTLGLYEGIKFSKTSGMWTEI